MKHLLDFVIISKSTAGGSAILKLAPADGAALPDILPGQFVEIKVEDSPATMLRRPISVCDVTPDGHLVLLIKPVGDGTRRLCALPEGARINILLPLGRGFSPAAAGERVLLVGGGVGAAPLVYLSRKLTEAGAKVTVAIGGRSAADLAGVLELYPEGVETVCSTDDGSRGTPGLITANEAFTREWDRICVCGPTPMMRAVARIARQRNITCEVSLENEMACGLGACLCCVEKTVEGNLCVCKDGPVFNINQLLWE